MKPLNFVYVFIFIFALIGYPIAKIIDQDGMLFYFVRHANISSLDRAYFWTVLATLLFVVANIFLGSHRRFNEFAQRPLDEGGIDPDLLWLVAFLASVGLTFYFFVQMDFTLPLLNLPGNVTELLMRRIEVKEKLNPLLFNLNATLLSPLAIILSVFFVRRRKALKSFLTIASFFVLGTFSLAKTSFVVGFLIVVIAYSFIRPLSIKSVVKVGLLIVLLLLPMFIVTKNKQAAHVRGEAIVEVVAARFIYGQWAALPFFLEMFERDRQPMKVLLPPYLSDGSAWERDGAEVPARKVMRAVTGYRILEGTGSGVAVTYFIGEAYAVGGEAGIVIGVLIVSLQICLLTFVFSQLGRTPLTIYAYSWFIYKFSIGLVTGMSAFVVSSLTLALLVLSLTVAFFKLGGSTLQRARTGAAGLAS